jgi:hypothetical protein
MKHGWLMMLLLASAIGLAGCASKTRHHDADLPDPKGYNAHFGDMDAGADGRVDWQEFKRHFPAAEPKVFEAVDLNKDGAIDHDEWHAFKEAHGLKHQ